MNAGRIRCKNWNFSFNFLIIKKKSFYLFAPVDLAILEFQKTWDHDAVAPQYEIY
jgi:hypothetical protein